MNRLNYVNNRSKQLSKVTTDINLNTLYVYVVQCLLNPDNCNIIIIQQLKEKKSIFRVSNFIARLIQAKVIPFWFSEYFNNDDIIILKQSSFVHKYKYTMMIASPSSIINTRSKFTSIYIFVNPFLRIIIHL